MSLNCKTAFQCLRFPGRAVRSVRCAHSRSYQPTLPAFSLAGKTAVITGGARGLGLAMSRSLVLSGANLAIIDIRSRSFHSADGFSQVGWAKLAS